MNTESVKQFVRRDIDNFTNWPLLPYFCETTEGKKKFVKLNMGESLFDVPQMIKSQISKLQLNYYPGFSFSLLEQIAEQNSVVKENVLLGNGSLGLIELIVRLCIESGDSAAVFTPTYPFYQYYVSLARGVTIEVPRINFQVLDIKTLRRKITPKTKLIILDSPSNPFGYQTPKEEIEELLQLGPIVVVDEAYFEYAQQNIVPLLKRYSNLIILRTFSKMIGLAGLRIGYLLASEEIVNYLVRIKNPEEVNCVAQFIARKMLTSGIAKKRITKLIEGRKYLIKGLLQIPFLEVYPSQGAYVVIRITANSIDTETINQTFYRKKILIKIMDFPGMTDRFIRFNVVPKALSKKLISVLRSLQP